MRSRDDVAKTRGYYLRRYDALFSEGKYSLADAYLKQAALLDWVLDWLYRDETDYAALADWSMGND